MGHLQILRCDDPYKLEIESVREKNSVRDGEVKETERGREKEKDSGRERVRLRKGEEIE